MEITVRNLLKFGFNCLTKKFRETLFYSPVKNSGNSYRNTGRRKVPLVRQSSSNPTETCPYVFVVGTLGLYSNDPAHSCKEIRDLGVSRKDGKYWIDPEKNGNPLNVYCDMTTDGGKWFMYVVTSFSRLRMMFDTSRRRLTLIVIFL